MSPKEPEPERESELALEPEPESTIEIIELDDPTELIGFCRSASEQPEARITSPAVLILPLAPLLQISSCPAPTMVNEHRLALTDRLTEQNNFVSTMPIFDRLAESFVSIRVAPIEPPEQLEIAPPNVPIVPDVVALTTLIVDNHSPLYNMNGYKVTQVTTSVT